MTEHDREDDSDLREAFAELRREDAERRPAFEAVLDARMKRRQVRSWAVLAAAAVSATVVVGSVLLRRPAQEQPAMDAMRHWIAPTDFLLKTPGREVLETAPRIGTRMSLTQPTSATTRPFAQRSVSP